MCDPLEMLSRIGRLLDRDVFPRILNGGIVTPDDTALPNSNWAKEPQDEQQGQRRSATEPRAGAAGRKRQANRPGETGTPPPPVSECLQDQYESQLTAVQLAYPGAHIWRTQDGLWLRTESTLLPRIWRKAVFLTGIPFSSRHIVRSWGFWVGTPQAYPTWIGPRHTNFPDGSICAFDPSDGTWNHGDSLVVLLDLYTVWSLRQLHLLTFGRWPGRQRAHYVHERLAETLPGEYCGCGSNTLYSACCQSNDLAQNRLLAAIEYFGFGSRKPPRLVERFIREQKDPLGIKELLPLYEVDTKGRVHRTIINTE